MKSDARARLEVALEAGEIATWVLDVPNDRVYGDAILGRYFNVAPVDLDGGPLERYTAAVHVDDRQRLGETIAASIASGSTFSAQYRVHSRDKMRWVLARGTVERDASGKPLYLPGVVLDISALHAAEEAVRANEERYRSLFESIEEGFCVMEMLYDEADRCVDYRFVELNPAFSKQTGLVDAVGKTARELVPGLEQHWFDIYGKVGLTGERTRFQNGSEPMGRWFDVDAFRVGDPSQHRVALLFKDITDARRINLALQESEAHFRRMTDDAPVVVWVTREDGFCEYLNRQWYAFTGQTREEAEGYGWLDVVHPDDRIASRDIFLAANAAHTTFTLEYRLRRQDGEYRWCVDTGAPRFEEGAFKGFIGTVTDIAERRAMEEDLRELAGERERLLDSERAARETAERTNRMKDEFLATLSHELRAPLNAILGWTQIMKGRTLDPVDAARGLDVIDRNARAQAQIVGDLLDMSSIISGKVRLDVQQLDLASVVSAAVETARPTADAKGVRLVAILDPLVGVAVSGDIHRMQQVLWNLLSNAVKFTPKGGKIQVVLERVNSHVEISVIDTGIGISPDFLPHVFDRFRQADASTTRRHGGLGLGLSIVKQLVDLHGGSVRVKSAGSGQGSTFSVALPLMAVAPPAHDRRHPKVPSEVDIDVSELVNVKGVRVLVVDDEADARGMLQRLLEDRGVVVTTVASAQEALDALQSETFDVMVSDIGMPDEDGYTLMRKVRALPEPRLREIPAIALTAYARTEDRVRAVAAGFLMHVAKPVNPIELVTMVAGATGRTGR